MRLFNKHKIFSSEWFEERMKEGVDFAGLSREEKKVIREAIKKASQRAEEAFHLGKDDAKSGKPKKDLKKLAENTNGLHAYPFMDLINTAYSTGYDITKAVN